jgi:hypothetical protein
VRIAMRIVRIAMRIVRIAMRIVRIAMRIVRIAVRIVRIVMCMLTSSKDSACSGSMTTTHVLHHNGPS